TDQDPVHRLQVEDALGHLANVEPKQAAPWRLPRLTPLAGLAVGVMLVMLMVAYPPTVSQASLPTGPLDVVLQQADLLEETMLEELEELAEETEDPELEKLAEEMKKAIEELREPEVDQYEALAQLSEMQATLAMALEQLETQKVDAELQELAEAL